MLLFTGYPANSNFAAPYKVLLRKTLYGAALRSYTAEKHGVWCSGAKVYSNFVTLIVLHLYFSLDWIFENMFLLIFSPTNRKKGYISFGRTNFQLALASQCIVNCTE